MISSTEFQVNYHIMSNIGSLFDLYDFCMKNTDKLFMQNDDFDKLIVNNYFILLQDSNLESMIMDESDFSDGWCDKIFVAIIILFDQIPRHAYRNWGQQYISIYLKKICDFVLRNYDRCEQLSAIDMSFALLPLRHTNDFKLITKVLTTVWNKIKSSDDKNEIKQYKKFLTATYTRYIKNNSDLRNLNMHDDFESNNDYNQLFNKLYLDSKCWRNKNVCMASNVNHMVYKNVKQVIKKNNVIYGIISLSGGVDSMVLSHILKNLGVNLIAVHINYSNRKECAEEEKIVINWCQNILKIPLFIRTIIEINRKDCMKYEMRELYESYTKSVRFNSYTNAQLHFTDQFDKDVQCNVFTGHNRDDCFENILTNIANKSHHENLTGMYPHANISDINFIRSMMDCNKSEIYDYALKHQIPFFVDSTPSWSQRGKIRDIVRPVLEKWNHNMVDSMFEISDALRSQSEYISENIKIFLKHNLESEGLFEFTIENLDDMAISKIFWKEIFNQLDIRVSNNSLDNLIMKMITIKEKCIKQNINVKNMVMLNKNTRLVWIYNGTNVIISSVLTKKID